MQTAVRILLLFLTLPSAWSQTRYFISTFAGSEPTGDNGLATQALLSKPGDVATDAAGNVYIADTGHNRIRKVTVAGTITTIAGIGLAGHTGDGGPATQAQCNAPKGVAVDPSGNVYFSDTSSGYVRKIAPDGIISSIAGNGTFSYSGDGGSATAAALYYPSGLAVDRAGNVLVADQYNHRIRRITPDGTIASVAGTGTCSATGDGSAAISATLCYPRALAIDSQGRVFVADMNNNRIRRFVPGGNIATVAGNGYVGSSGDNGPAVNAHLYYPQGVAVDSTGVIYIADTSGQRIRMVGLDGVIKLISGSSTGFRGDTTTAVNGQFSSPLGIALDSLNNLYVADSNNDRVRVISALRMMNTFAGTGHYSGDNGPAASAVMTTPSFMTMDSLGDFYVSDQGNHVIRKIDHTGRITTIAGTGVSGNAGDSGPALKAQIGNPEGLAVDTAGNLYVVDSYYGTVRMITPAGVIQKIAGGGRALGDGGPARSAYLYFPHGIAIDAKGNLYVADTSNNRVRRIAPDNTISTFIGDGTAHSTGDGGLASAAGLSKPWDVKIAADGGIYIGDYYGGQVRAVAPNGIVNTVAYLAFSYAGMAFDPDSNLIVAGPNKVVSVNHAGEWTLLAGGSTYGFDGDGGPALTAVLNYPEGVVTDAKGNIYFCDQKNNRVRKLAPDTVSQAFIVSGDKQTGPVGTALPVALVIQVNGASGVAFPGVPVAFAITSGAGKLSAAQTLSGSDGRAGVTLTLPPPVGDVTVTATVAGLPVLTFTATAVNMPGTLSIVGGNNQSSVAGSTLPQILSVAVTGLDKNPIAGVPVTFAVTSGSAKLDPASMTTGKDGAAWTLVTLGNTPGPVSVSATVAGLPPVRFSLTATALDGPQIFPGGVVGAGLSTPVVQTVSPNAIVSIFGRNFAPSGTSRKVASSDLVDGMLPTNLGGVCVLFGAERAPLFLVTPGQLNVQVPQVAVPSTPAVQVITGCDTPAQSASSMVPVAVQAASPEFFYAASNSEGKNPVAAADAQTGAGIGDPVRLGPGFAPAYPGEILTLYATGLGLTTPAFSAGQLPPGGAQVASIMVSIDGTPLDPSAIRYAGVAPMSAGLYQLNVVLPAYLTNGDHTIMMSVSGVRSPAGGYLTVGNNSAR